MRHTDNPLAYTFAKPQAKHILYLLEHDSPQPYSTLRDQTNTDPKTFRRLTQRLAQFNLLHQRAPTENDPVNNRVRVLLELTQDGRELLQALHDIDQVLHQHTPALGSNMTNALLVASDHR